MTSHTMLTAGAAAALLCCCQLNTSCAAAGQRGRQRMQVCNMSGSEQQRPMDSQTMRRQLDCSWQRAIAYQAPGPALAKPPPRTTAPHLHQPLARLHCIVVACQLLSVDHVHVIACRWRSSNQLSGSQDMA